MHEHEFEWGLLEAIHLVDDEMDLSSPPPFFSDEQATVHIKGHIKQPPALCPLYHDASPVVVPCLFTSSVN